MLIGEKIRLLRKNKKLTQMQLAEALSVSAQSVSKWETHLSAPDISILPDIARYFGVTMDELFNYRLDTLNYKERFIRFMVNNGMLRFGDFTLKSGRRSPYLIHGGYNLCGSQISKLGDFYAECIKNKSIESNSLIGIDKREVPLVIATSMMLFNKYGIDVPHCVDLDINSDASLLGDLTLITDTFTSGTSLSEALDRIQNKLNKLPRDIIVCVDRMERTEESSLSAKHTLETKYGVKIHPIVTSEDILNAIESGCITEPNYIKSFKEYLNKYKGE